LRRVRERLFTLTVLDSLIMQKMKVMKVLLLQDKLREMVHLTREMVQMAQWGMMIR
jgi:hypothetical protein